MKNIVNFKCIPERCTYKSENFKIYGTVVDTRDYPDIKLNKYNNITILGNLHDLAIGIEYNVKAEEQKGKYGYQYKVINIKRERPQNVQSTKMFLREILTNQQTEVLLSIYPDIVERVMNDRLNDIDLSKTKGIKEFTFNVIKKKIIENFVFSELVEEFYGLINFPTLKKLYEKYPSVKKIKTAIKNEPYKCLCDLSGIGFKTADGVILEFDKETKKMLSKNEEPPFIFEFDLKKSKQREKAAILYLLEKNEKDGNTKINVKTLREQSNKLTPECVNFFADIIKNDDDIYFNKKTKFVTIKNTYETELYIANRIKEGLEKNEVWDIKLDKCKKVDGIELTNQQFNALKNITKYDISILNGFAGTGKTQTTNTIIKMLKDNKKSFKLFAPTGRAAKVLSGYTKENASTIHRGLEYMPPNTWTFNEDFKLNCDILIVDEFSMVDIFIMKRLIEAIDFSKTKLLIIGDSFQIPSVGAGNVLFDLVNSNIIPITSLTEVFRFGKGGKMTVATMTRTGDNFVDDKCNKMKSFGEDKDYIYVPIRQENLVSNVKGLYKKLLDNGKKVEDILILSSYNIGNYGTIAINQKIQAIANKNYNIDKKFVFGNTTFYKDDLVIQIINNYKADIYTGESSFNVESEQTFIPNGNIGKIIEVKKDFIVVKFDKHKIKYTKETAQQLKLAYCISIHKSQGGSCNTVILLTPKAHTHMLNANILYVGQTRATEKLFHLGEPKAVNRAIKKKANFNRKTLLKEFLLEE